MDFDYFVIFFSCRHKSNRKVGVTNRKWTWQLEEQGLDDEPEGNQGHEIVKLVGHAHDKAQKNSE